MNAFYALFSPNGMLRSPDWRMFVLKWTVLTALGWILVGVLGTTTLAQAGTVATGVLYAEPGELVWLFAAGLIAMGAAVGVLQWVALTELLPQAHRWALATVAGCLLAALIGFFLLRTTWMRTAALAVALVLVLQTVALRHVTYPSVRWAFGCLASMIPAGLVGVASYWFLASVFNVASQQVAPEMILGQMTGTGMAFSLGFLAPFGLLFGVLSGDLLAWILVNKLRREDGVAAIWPSN